MSPETITETPAPVLITYADAVARVEKVAEGREDYVNAESNGEGGFKTCRYLNKDRSPSCIVGQAFHAEIIEAGLDYTDAMNRRAVGQLIQQVLAGRVQVTHKALRFLENVQGSQDGGATWGNAIDSAKSYIEEADVNPYLTMNDTDPVPEPQYV